MCGRYYLDTLPELMREHFGATPPGAYAPHWNIAPTQHAPVLRRHGDEVEFAMLRWGLVPYWAKDPAIASRLINARGDGIADKPAYRAAYRKRRCVVPATGFFEWRVEGSVKQPYAIVPTSAPCFGFAGLWEAWTDPSGAALETFAIVTTEPNSRMHELHDRMPLILEPADYARWITGRTEEAAGLIRPSPSESLRYFPVSRAVSNAKNDRPDLVQPVAAPMQRLL